LDPRPQLSIGPADGSLLVKPYRDGLAAKAGHDLVIEVTRWQAKIATAAAALELAADPRSLDVRAPADGSGLSGLRALSLRRMDPVSIHEAKTQFSRLIARAEAGEEIVVRRGAKPVAKIVAYHPPTTPRVPGALKGEIDIADDFDETPDDFAEYTA
jgi:prevent-host-death family protein